MASVKYKPFPAELSQRDIARFWSKVDVRGPEECWPWKASLTNSGYGQFEMLYGMWLSHRVCYFICCQEDPANSLVLHSCDNPPCCNPKHLFKGDHQDNVDDMIAKGRGAFGDKHWSKLKPECRATGDRNGSRTHPERLPRGEQVHGSKLKEPDVREIRHLLAEGHLYHREIAEMFGVTESLIDQIARGKIWRHVV